VNQGTSDVGLTFVVVSNLPHGSLEFKLGTVCLQIVLCFQLHQKNKRGHSALETIFWERGGGAPVALLGGGRQIRSHAKRRHHDGYQRDESHIYFEYEELDVCQLIFTWRAVRPVCNFHTPWHCQSSAPSCTLNSKKRNHIHL
jgi:hypothetical protein